MKDLSYRHVTHESVPAFLPENARILILGSLPSAKSREQGFYYAHKTNRFFKVLAGVFQEEEPKTVAERKTFLTRHHIALYDVIEECDIHGSSDSSIKNVIPADIPAILRRYPAIEAVYTTGTLANHLYHRYVADEVIALPSPSAANASMSLSRLIEAYQVIRKVCD